MSATNDIRGIERYDRVGDVTYITSTWTHTLWQSTITEPKQMIATAVGTEGDILRLKAKLQEEFPNIPFVVAPLGSFPKWEGKADS